MKAATVVVAGMLVGAGSIAYGGDRVLRVEMAVAAGMEEVWNAWASEEGVKTFFAPGAHVEPRVDGAYEIFFNPRGEPGQRGAEGMRVLAFEPPRRLVFTWNAPRPSRAPVDLDWEQPTRWLFVPSSSTVPDSRSPRCPPRTGPARRVRARARSGGYRCPRRCCAGWASRVR